MVENNYELELSKLGETYKDALHQDVENLKAAIAGASEYCILCVGSGGSFTIASLFCNFHEIYTGRVSRPSTPLEIICNPTLASSSPVFLITAEGKNPDIIEALERAKRHSARTIHVITNRSNSAIVECADKLTDIKKHIFHLNDKDGFLATNSLLLDAVIIARAYNELDNAVDPLPSSIEELELGNKAKIHEWLEVFNFHIKNIASKKGIIITYSPNLRPLALDLESKLSESALLFCQTADLRSFAHGRHLWVAERPEDCMVLAFVENELGNLWSNMVNMLPKDFPVITVPFSGSKPQDLIAGLIVEMHIVSLIAKEKNRDLGKPNVPQFGRDLHYTNINELIPKPNECIYNDQRSKYEIIGARWPFVEKRGAMRRASEDFINALKKQCFKSIIFDYDGTLTNSQRNDNPPPPEVIAKLSFLLEKNIIIGIATGRGDSVQKHIRDTIPNEFWGNIHLGLYNSGIMISVADTITACIETSEYLYHVKRIVGKLKDLGVPIEKIKETHPFQLSIRFKEGVQASNLWFVIADAIRQEGLDVNNVVRSKHSVDILSKGVNKAHLVAHLIRKFKIEPYQILTIGDQGAWPGNDTSLLEHKFSLSVDNPSRRLDRGWNLAPIHLRDVDATIWYLDKIIINHNATFSIDIGLDR